VTEGFKISAFVVSCIIVYAAAPFLIDQYDLWKLRRWHATNEYKALKEEDNTLQRICCDAYTSTRSYQHIQYRLTRSALLYNSRMGLAAREKRK
jgi:hypothetical protein